MAVQIPALSYSSILGGVKKAALGYVNWTFGTGTDIFGATLGQSLRKDKFSNLGTNIKNAYNTMNSNTSTHAIETARGIFDLKKWGSLSSNLKSASWLGRGKILGGAIFRRMPLVGNLVGLGMAVPTVMAAYSEKGVVTGTIEVVKEASKLAAFAGGAAAGAAIGTALFPGVGSIIGGIVGGVVTGFILPKVFGHTYLEKKQEVAQAEIAKNAPGQQAEGQSQGALTQAQQGVCEQANPAFGSLTSPAQVANNTYQPQTENGKLWANYFNSLKSGATA